MGDVIPLAAFPSLDSVIAKVELAPLRMNQSKNDSVGPGQIALAKDVRSAALLRYPPPPYQFPPPILIVPLPCSVFNHPMPGIHNKAFSRILIEAALEFSDWDLRDPHQVRFK